MSATRPDFGSPYNNFYGDKYEELPTVKEVAAAVRKELNVGTKDKASPLYGAKVSVRYETFAGGCAIRTNINSPEHVVHVWNSWDDNSPDTVCTICGKQLIWARSEAGGRRFWLTEKGRAINELAESLLAAHNHDRSDIQTDYFDVRFYGQVRVENMKEAVK